jgi:hypothetical protein
VSTFLVSLGVVAATIAAVIYVAVSGPDQPATLRRQPSRARRPRSERRDRRAARRVLTPTSDPGAAAGLEAAHQQTVVVEPEWTAVAAPPTPPLRPQPALAVPGLSGAGALALPDSDPMRLRILPAKPTTLWVRFRSGVALLVLVAVLGALLAIVVGGVLVGAAFLLRSATG